MLEVITFESALGRANGNKNLLLGNGFSRACRNDIFSYDALFDRATFDGLSLTARGAFNALGTTDFEVVIRALRQAAQLMAIYAESHPGLALQLTADANGLRELLASTIARSHPDRPAEIGDASYSACRTFLSSFKSIYTLNYDLLLYWALMQREIPPVLKSDDGFRSPEEPTDYVTWDVENTIGQNIHYIHGGLHIFDAGSELQKFTWCNTGMALIDQIRAALDSNRYPLIVAEGSAESKLDKIQHSGYLSRAFRSFSAISGTLFIFGVSFGVMDEHILKLLNKGKVSQMFISLHGDPESDGNKAIAQCAELMVSLRSPKRPLEVHFFDASSAQVWG